MHIESRKSMRTNSEYEIFVDLENENGEVSVPSLVKSLKRQISHIQIDSVDERLRQNSEKEIARADSFTNGGSVGGGGGSGLVDDVFHTEKFIDTTNTSLFNSDGVMIRKSKNTIPIIDLIKFGRD